MKYIKLYEGFFDDVNRINKDWYDTDNEIRTAKANGLSTGEYDVLRDKKDEAERELEELETKLDVIIRGFLTSYGTQIMVKDWGYVYSYEINAPIFGEKDRREIKYIFLYKDGMNDEEQIGMNDENGKDKNITHMGEILGWIVDIIMEKHPEYFEGEAMGFFNMNESKALKGDKIIENLFKNGKSKTIFPVKAVYLPSNETKLLVSAPIKKFERAVDRNTIKRMLKAAMQKEEKNLTKNYTIAFIYLGTTILEAEKIENAVAKIIKQLNK